MFQSRDRPHDRVHLQWAVVLIFGLGAFASFAGFVQLLVGFPHLSLLVGVFAGGLVAFSVHVVTTVNARQIHPVRHP